MTFKMFAVLNGKNEMLHRYTRATRVYVENEISKDGYSVTGLKLMGWRIVEVEIKVIEK